MEKTSKMSYNSFKDLIRLRPGRTKFFLRVLGENAFIFILIFILIEIIFGEFLFYKYIFAVRVREPQITGNLIEFQEKTYQFILGERQKREEMFKDSLKEAYSDPFFPVSDTNNKE